MKYPFLDLGPVNAPYFDEITRAIERVVHSGRYVGGEECDRLEENLKALTGAEYAIGVSNGLDALRLILRAWVQLGRLKPGDEVIVPANTYIASVLAITDASLIPVLAEPSEKTLNLDFDRLDGYITPRTRAIMPVHLYGRVCWSEEMEAFVKRHNLLVIEDNAQAIGASWRGRSTGNLGDAAAFSFYPTKNIGALGDAGAVTTSDPELAKAVRALANYGSDRRYHCIYTGFNCRLDPMQAAVLNVKLPHVNEENELRRGLADIYRNNISHPGITLPEVTTDPAEHVYHQFVILAGRRDELMEYLAANGVGTDIHYPEPVNRQPCYSDIFGNLSYPVAERLASQYISLPITRCTSSDDARQIAGIINNFQTY